MPSPPWPGGDKREAGSPDGVEFDPVVPVRADFRHFGNQFGGFFPSGTGKKNGAAADRADKDPLSDARFHIWQGVPAFLALSFR